MSVDRVSGECRVVGLLLMDGGVSVLYVLSCISFSNFRVCGCRDNM